MSVRVRFDDYDLDHVSEWSENLETRISETSVPRRHGSYHEDLAVYGSRQITMRGTIFGADWTECRTELREMKKRASLGVRKLYFDDDEYIWAIMSSISHSHTALRGQGKAVDFAMNFICKDPFFYQLSGSSEQDTDMADNDTLVVTNNGNITTPAQLTILSAGSSTTAVTITNTNASINKYIQYSGIINSGETLLTDHRVATMEKDSVSVLNDFEGDFWQLAPGSNSIKVGFDSGSNVNLTVEYTERNV